MTERVPYDCKLAEKRPVTLHLNAAELVQITNALSYALEDGGRFGEIMDTNCDDCDDIMRNLYIRLNEISARATRDLQETD